jgi:hypothetical protein
MKETPIFICTRDRVWMTKTLVARLHAQGYFNLTLFDAGSTYPPMLDFLDRTDAAVIRYIPDLTTAKPHHAFWLQGFVRRANGGPFVYTDCDVVPAADCPDDWVAKLSEQLKRYPDMPKAGLGLKTDDLPDHYAQKQKVIDWEKQYTAEEAQPGLWRSAIDTTLALYRNADTIGLSKALRSTKPYMARHLPWYSDSAFLTEEEVYYRDHMDKRVGMWKP